MGANQPDIECCHPPLDQKSLLRNLLVPNQLGIKSSQWYQEWHVHPLPPILKNDGGVQVSLTNAG